MTVEVLPTAPPPPSAVAAQAGVTTTPTVPAPRKASPVMVADKIDKLETLIAKKTETITNAQAKLGEAQQKLALLQAQFKELGGDPTAIRASQLERAAKKRDQYTRLLKKYNVTDKDVAAAAAPAPAK